MALRTILDAALTERQLQAQWQQWCDTFGWRNYHPFRSDRSAKGWPDNAAVRGACLWLTELKTVRGRLSPEQREWLEALQGVERLRVEVVRPDSWPAIEHIFREGF